MGKWIGDALVYLCLAYALRCQNADFKVHANGKTYYANCAWDMLGIPVALHTDAIIEAVCTESNETVQLEISHGNIYTLGGDGSTLLVHFPLSFARWYDDLVFT